MMSTDESPAAVRHDRHAQVLAVIFISVCAIYGQTLSFGFVGYDDDKYVTDNALVQQGLTVASIREAFTQVHYANWHPLTTISHEFAYALFGLSAWGHHLLNVLLHLANGLLLYWVLFRYTARWLPAAAVAILFTVHPLHVESVAWVSSRKDVLSAFFGLLALLAYREYALTPTVKRYALVAFLFALGLLAKPMLVTLPFALLLLDYWPLQRTSQKNTAPLVLEKLPLIALSVAASAITYIAQGDGGAVRSFETVPLGTRIANAVVSYLRYIELTLWPHDLTMLYPYSESLYHPVVVFGSVLILLIATAFAFLYAKRFPPILVGWLWYLGTLVPVVGLIQVGSQTHADRYTYLPHIGLFIAIVWGIAALIDARPKLLRPLIAAAAAILLIYTGLAWKQTRYWRDSTALYTHAIAVTQNNRVAHNNLGNELLKQDRPQEAIRHLQRALEIDPDYLRANANLANAYVAVNNPQEAIGYYKRALDLAPDDAKIRTNFANTYMAVGQFSDAIAQFNRALEFEPNLPQALNGLGACHYQLGDYPQAIRAFEQALAIDPQYATAARNLQAAKSKILNTP